MKLKKSIVISILCVFNLPLFAQYDDLLNNKNVIWVMESYNDFQTELRATDRIGKQISSVAPLKYVNVGEDNGIEDFFLQDFITDAVREEKVNIFSDSDCQINISNKDIFQSKDTTSMTIDPITYETKYNVSINYLSFNNISFFRVHQIIYYDIIKHQFGLRTLAIAPMVKNWKRNTFYPLFWFKATDLPQSRNLNDISITWASRMNLKEGIILNDEDNNYKTIKSIGEYPAIKSLFDDFTSNFKIPFYKTHNLVIKDTFEFSERQTMLMRRETINVIDPTTLATELKVKITDIQPKDIKRLRLIQNWYWDNSKNRLEIWLKAVAPLKEVNIENGEFLYRHPLFYRRTDD